MKRNFWIVLVVILLMSIPLFTPASNGGKPGVYALNIRNAIGNGLREYISRGVNLAKSEGADVLLFDIHTPGGAVSATSDIIRTIDDSGLPTIAFVDVLERHDIVARTRRGRKVEQHGLAAARRLDAVDLFELFNPALHLGRM